MSEIPKGWVASPLLDVVDLHDSRRIPLNATQRAQRRGEYPYYGANGQVDSIDDYIFDGEYVLLAEDGGYFDDPSRGVAYEVSGKFWVNNHAHILSARGGIPRRYITHALNFLAWLPYVSGTTRLKLTQQGMQKVKLPLPPLPEQRRIVANLDSLFECTRRAREELSHIPRLIENYKKAILEAAFRGDLTKDWRASHPGQTVKADSNSIDNRCRPLPELPSAWSWSSVASASIVSGGLTKNARRRDLAKKVPYLRVANVYANELRLDDIQEIGCTPAEYEKTHLRLGDLLVVEGNGSIDQIGRVAMWDNSISNCSHQNHLIRVRARLTITPEYLLFWLLSPLGRQSIERVASSSSGLHTLSISKVSTLPVPMCTIEEMKEITARINVYLSQIEGVFADSAQAEHLLDRLDQANLSKAFRGELVPQDPTDEPASVLLQRIRSVDGAQLQSHSRARRRRNQGVVA